MGWGWILGYYIGVFCAAIVKIFGCGEGVGVIPTISETAQQKKCGIQYRVGSLFSCQIACFFSISVKPCG